MEKKKLYPTIHGKYELFKLFRYILIVSGLVD